MSNAYIIFFFLKEGVLLCTRQLKLGGDYRQTVDEHTA